MALSCLSCGRMVTFCIALTKTPNKVYIYQQQQTDEDKIS